jgi:hypothetical protein
MNDYIEVEGERPQTCGRPRLFLLWFGLTQELVYIGAAGLSFLI